MAVPGDEVGRRLGESGGNGEGLESYPLVVVGGAEVVGAGLSTARGGRRRVCSGDAGRAKSDRGASVGRGQARGGFDLGRDGPGRWLHARPGKGRR